MRGGSETGAGSGCGEKINPRVFGTRPSGPADFGDPVDCRLSDDAPGTKFPILEVHR